MNAKDSSSSRGNWKFAALSSRFTFELKCVSYQLQKFPDEWTIMSGKCFGNMSFILWKKRKKWKLFSQQFNFQFLFDFSGFFFQFISNLWSIQLFFWYSCLWLKWKRETTTIYLFLYIFSIISILEGVKYLKRFFIFFHAFFLWEQKNCQYLLFSFVDEISIVRKS